jgi:hypothetical protein
MLAASVLFAMVPVVFGVIRAVNTGADVRYFWLAGAAILGSIAIMPPRRGAAGHAGVSLPRAVGAVAAGAICAGLVAIAMGAKAGPGIAIVAIAFGLCTGASAIFATLARLDSMSGLTDDPFNDGRQREGAEGE